MCHTVTMFQEGLMDRHEFLTWVIENVEKSKQLEETILKLVLKELLQVLFFLDILEQVLDKFFNIFIFFFN